LRRRDFFKQAAGAIAAAAQVTGWQSTAEAATPASPRKVSERTAGIAFPRVFSGEQLKMIAFPLGGVGAGSLSLGGRGQLREWQIYNRANQGNSLPYAFPAIFVQVGDAKPVARVLESRILPPYEGQNGLDVMNVPGLPRLASAEFTGAYPFARVDFTDEKLPVHVSLEAFSPFIPHDPEDSGLPMAVLRYRVRNAGSKSAKVGISFAIENPVTQEVFDPNLGRKGPETRVNVYRSADGLDGLLMTNPAQKDDDPWHGSFTLGVLTDANAKTTHWRGWKADRWHNSPMLYWDAFSKDGELLEEPAKTDITGCVCQNRTVAPGASAEFTFVLAWHFPNRTPDSMGWRAPAGKGGTIIGNYYGVRFKDAWEVAAYTAANLPSLEERTRAFADAFTASTLPGVVKDAASANLSTLASTTCFRAASGEFYGFEGAYDHTGSCYGNSTHVWNYETVTAHLFPTYSRSMRKTSFFDNMTDAGGIPLRMMLPVSKERTKLIPTDGQMGQIIHAYMDWKLCGDTEWLKTFWPRVKQAIEYSWVHWDADRDGVMEGEQPNTYDVAFFGPNPLCGIYYLGGLRAAEEMARAVGDDASATLYRGLFDKGSQWIDANLFNGEYYIQDVRTATGGAYPEYQVGKGCLIDQLTGQYLACVAGLGPLVSMQNARTSLESVYKYNYKHTLVDHVSVQRTYALNDEAAVLICDYGKAERPEIPFPYYAEAWTGLEYSTAAVMFYNGMIAQGLEFMQVARSRFDGVRRNPWDECEAGHHYVRAMSSWSSVVALSGFHYEGDRGHVEAIPRVAHDDFQCFWATGTGWGTFSLKKSGAGTRFALKVIAGELPCGSFALDATGTKATAKVGTKSLVARVEKKDAKTIVRLAEAITLHEGELLEIEVVV